MTSIKELAIKDNTKLLNSMVSGNLEILDSIDAGSNSMTFKSRSNGNVKIAKLNITKKISEKIRNQYILDPYAYFGSDENEYNKGTLTEFKKNMLKKDYVSESCLCFIVYQILNGLKYIHERKIAHLDLKPENIVVGDYLTVKLIDFSISLDYSKTGAKKIKLPFVGTCFYRAPEILSQKTIDVKDLNKVDLYSLGVIIFNLAFDSYPYGLTDEDIEENQEYSKILKKIENGNLKIDNEDNDFSSYFIDFLKSLLEKDISKRININKALDHYWIKGAKILKDETENLFNSEKFIEDLINNSFISFNHYMNKN
jgi:serine/threonine protein kinase